MKKYIIALAAIALWGCNSSEEITSSEVREPVSTIFEYTPAPGQFINEPQSGYEGVDSPEKACAYVAKRFAENNYVSLGGWGGYIVVGFAQSVPASASGDYELYVTGNQFETSSEPGTVWVAQDSNGDGRPEGETWYELRGSEYDNPATIKNYEITYSLPDPAGNVAWTDNQGTSGTIDRISDHSHDSYFPKWIKTGTLTFKGTRLPDNVKKVGNEWTAQPFAWGYADNYSSIDRKGMTNFFRISDAVTTEGRTAGLTSIDFVRVQTGVNAKAELIGEVSTEVCGIGCIRITKK